MKNAPILYVAPKPQAELLHALKRVWAALMLLRGAKRSRAAAKRGP